jgi:predicted dinucleotide-binding enzyme
MNWLQRTSQMMALVLGALAMSAAQAETIAVIGTGNVARALGPAFAGLGHTIVYGSRDPVLAIPWDAAEQVVTALGDLAGKVILDPTNPRYIGDDGLRDYAFDGSNAERIQQWAPEAHVVKAFNTMTAGLMANPASAGGPVTVPLVGNDPQAKAIVAELAEGIGFETLDLGPVRFAHVVEGMYLVWGNARRNGNTFEYFFRRPPGQ